jgi:hypothetical protein
MYLREIRIENIRSIKQLVWRVPQGKVDGWHVIIGDNGSGKSSLLCSIALTLLGPIDAYGLRQSWDGWLRNDQQSGFIELSLDRDESVDILDSKSDRPKGFGYPAKMIFVREKRNSHRELVGASWPDVGLGFDAWELSNGWFCAAFGPYRRLRGGDSESNHVSSKRPRLARYLSIFEESYALMDCIEWLQALRFRQLEDEKDSDTTRPGRDLLPTLIKFINQPDFLPHQAMLKEITSDSVLFVDGNGMKVRIEDLSDGYRSILSMTFELIRQLARAYGPERVFDPDDPTKVICPGVVLIDEVDVHLHPSWQRQIGLFFRKHFPKIQFIVTTHSPLICQAADIGTVFVLPRPGEEGRGEMLEGARLERLLYGNLLDAYGTEVFGRNIDRSDEAKKMRKRLATLNVRETREGLTESERQEQLRLRGAMPTSALSRDTDDDPDR